MLGPEPRNRGPKSRNSPVQGTRARPVPVRRAAAKRTSAPSQGGLTGRATAMLVILAALALGYAYPVRVYLTQLAEIDALEKSHQEQRAHIKGLEDTVAKWHDDEYVRIQARKRLFWVYPGETPLIPIWEGTVDTGEVAPPPPPDIWYEVLWTSLEAAQQQ